MSLWYLISTYMMPTGHMTISNISHVVFSYYMNLNNRQQHMLVLLSICYKHLISRSCTSITKLFEGCHAPSEFRIGAVLLTPRMSVSFRL